MIKNEKGITLIEVLLSMAILSIVLLTIFNFFPQIGMLNQYNGNKAVGVNIAKKYLVQWKDSNEVIEFLLDPDLSPPPDGYDHEDSNYFYYKKTTNDFDVHIKIKKSSELNSTPAKAHLIQIEVIEDGKTISETYGYVTIDD
ncbi:type IV pilus modification PilV family protein [Rossellomorea aquimaris]|uniref:type IV pilus modification PilV family protein n=1 Tax=Rossellomorea aquimaris TaxID=189382 RepID=UPI0007D07804|nr:prepilin-type N-terminal cleavage/methylation domain-containing protein [Rossellomorea aquimaris]